MGKANIIMLMEIDMRDNLRIIKSKNKVLKLNKEIKIYIKKYKKI
jgi:hypothetical protein